MAATAFGKFLRKLRVDNDLLLKDMAESMEVSTAQLSAMELGNRTIQLDLASKIANIYNVSNVEEIEELISISQPSIKTNLKDVNEEQRKTMVMFARAFSDMSDDRLKQIQELVMNTK